MKGNKPQPKKGGYQPYDSEEEEEQHHYSDDQNFGDSSSDKNSANMGSAPEDSDSNNEDNKRQKNRQKGNIQQQGAAARNQPQQSKQNVVEQSIQMTNLKKGQNIEQNNQSRYPNQNYGSGQRNEEQVSQNNPSKNNAVKGILKNQNMRPSQRMNDSSDEEQQGQINKYNQKYDDDNNNSSDEDVEQTNNQRDVENQTWKKKLVQNQQDKSKEININQSQSSQNNRAQPKPAISKLSQNIKSKQKHVKLVEEDEQDSNGEEIQQNAQNIEDESDEDEAAYQQKNHRLKEEKQIRQRLSDERKKELEKKKKTKKQRKFDADEGEDEDEDEEDEDDDYDDDDIDYDYDDYGNENKRKREEYDITNTMQQWIGFVIILVFMSVLYFFMVQKGFNTYNNRDYNSSKKNLNKTISFYPRTNYPSDIYFNNDVWRESKEYDDRRDEATCKKDDDSFFDFQINLSQTQSRYFKTFINLDCKRDCSTLWTKEVSEEVYKNTANINEDKENSINYDNILDSFKCEEVKESFFNGSCSECNDCYMCSPFSHKCYSCYDQQYILAGKCQQTCGEIESVIDHFCIKEKPGMNLQLIKGMQHNLYLLHTPEKMGNISELEDEDEIAKLPKNLSGKELKDKIDEIQKKQGEKKELKKYPFIILLNDYRYTQDSVFLSKQIEKYFDRAFILSLPYFKEMHSATYIHNMVADLFGKELQYIKSQIDFYAVVGFGITGQVAASLALNQEDNRESFWRMKVAIATATSENSFVSIINQDDNSFQKYINSKETYFIENIYCYHEERQKQIKSASVEFKPNLELDDQESILEDHLDFYIKHSFDEIFLHYDKEKLSLLKF